MKKGKSLKNVDFTLWGVGDVQLGKPTIVRYAINGSRDVTVAEVDISDEVLKEFFGVVTAHMEDGVVRDYPLRGARGSS